LIEYDPIDSSFTPAYLEECPLNEATITPQSTVCHPCTQIYDQAVTDFEIFIARSVCT